MNLDKEKDLIEDFNLWNNFKEGDEKSFSRIFRLYYSFLYNYGIKLTNDPDLTKDCIQELFISLWKNKSNLGSAPSIKFYLLKSLRRKIARRKSEKNRFSYPLSEDYEFEIVFSIENVIISRQLENEQQEYFLNLLNRLSKRQKEAVYLKFYQNLTYDEIGEIMNVNYQSIRNYIHQAITTLRKEAKVPEKLLYLLICLEIG